MKLRTLAAVAALSVSMFAGQALADGRVTAVALLEQALARMGKVPLLALGMRLGEGTGAALAAGIVKAAVACHTGMATFAQAGVSDRS